MITKPKTKIKILNNKLVQVVVLAGLVKILLSPLSTKLATGLVFLSILMLTALFISRQTKWQYKPFIAGFVGTAIYNIGLMASLSMAINWTAVSIPALEVGVIALIIYKVMSK